MEEKKIKHRVEIMGDYDGILYNEYEDGTKQNVHTGIWFDEYKQRKEYSPAIQFKDGMLVGYSRYKAEGLTEEDDLSEGKNLLWGTRGIDGSNKLIFRPIKDLSIPHIKAIIIEGHTREKEYLSAFTDALTSVITITNE